MRKLVLLAGLVAVAGGRLGAQGVTDRTGARAEMLRQRIEARFAERVREDLGLDSAQSVRLRAEGARFAADRRELQGRERAARQAMAAALRPGVAADQDSVSRLIDELLSTRAAYAESYRSEMRSLAAFLTPVPRARYLILRERLLNLAPTVRAERLLGADSGAAPARRAPFRQRRLR